MARPKEESVREGVPAMSEMSSDSTNVMAAKKKVAVTKAVFCIHQIILDHQGAVAVCVPS